jgi:hypothetical protein
VAKKLYKADRDFDHFRVGEVYELDEEDPYVRTGYLEVFEPEAPAEAEAEVLPAGLSETTDSTPETGADGAAPVTEEANDGGNGAGPAGSGSKPRTRSRG